MNIPNLIGSVRREVLERLLKPDVSAAALYQTTDFLMNLLSMASEQLPDKERWACKKGCALCCHFPVGVFGLEALFIAHYMETNLTPEEKNTFVMGLEVLDAEARNTTWAGLHRTRRECLFLTDKDECGIYDMRPMGCRSLYSTSFKACETVFQMEGRDPVMPFDDTPITLLGGIVAGLCLALKELKIPIRRYELHSALACALKTENASRRWLRGKNIFKDCVPDTAFDGSIHQSVLNQLETMIHEPD